jgi:hypothetical protein
MQFRYANIVSSNHIVTSTSSSRTQPRSSSDDPGPGDVATDAEAYIDNVFIGGIDGDVDVVNPPTLQEDLSDIIFCFCRQVRSHRKLHDFLLGVSYPHDDFHRQGLTMFLI